VIKRGDIYMVDFNPARGSEQAGFRPALIIQNDIGNKFSPTTIVATITTADRKQFPFAVKLIAPEGGLEKDSLVNLAQILTIDKIRLENKIGSLKINRMNEINEAIRISLSV
jgi:mRNA interferase MazF